jgi:hypothetical protein
LRVYSVYKEHVFLRSAAFFRYITSLQYEHVLGVADDGENAHSKGPCG